MRTHKRVDHQCDRKAFNSRLGYRDRSIYAMLALWMFCFDEWEPMIKEGPYQLVNPAALVTT